MDIFEIAKQICKNSKNIIGDSCIKDNYGKLSFIDAANQKTMKEHYKNFFNVKFSWPNYELPIVKPSEGTAPLIIEGNVAVARYHPA